MATFKEVTQPYEVLIRFTDGVVTGAHYQTITTVTRDGVIFGVPVIDEPQQLSAVEGQDGDLLTTVLGDNVKNLVSVNQDQTKQIQQLSSLVEQLTAKVSELESKESVVQE